MGERLGNWLIEVKEKHGLIKEENTPSTSALPKKHERSQTGLIRLAIRGE